MSSPYTCEWPGCEELFATEFVDTDETHRPVCTQHAGGARMSGAKVRPILEIDHLKVPYKPPTQREREQWPGDFREVRRHSDAGRTDTGPAIPCAPTMPSRPPLREAFAHLAGALLDKAKEEVERWRKQ